MHINNEIVRALDDAAFMKEFCGYLSREKPELLKVVLKLNGPKPEYMINNDLIADFSNEILLFMRENIFRRAEREETGGR